MASIGLRSPLLFKNRLLSRHQDGIVSISSNICVSLMKDYGIVLETSFSGPKPFSVRKTSLVVRGKDSSSSTVVLEEVEFIWKGSCNEVLLTGDFFNWNEKIAMTKTSDNCFQTKQKIPIGSHTFKFIVDGVWQHSSEYPTVEDGAGGFNNLIDVKEKPLSVRAAAPPPTPKETPKAKAKEAEETSKPKPKPAPKPKPVEKSISATMNEDIIPLLKGKLEPVKGLSELSLEFADNQLRGCFTKDDVPYAFWCYFPDGILSGARGFSLATHGGAPSTVEPFIIDEKKITVEIVVFWIVKRLFAQKLLTLN